MLLERCCGQMLLGRWRSAERPLGGVAGRRRGTITHVCGQKIIIESSATTPAVDYCCLEILQTPYNLLTISLQTPYKALQSLTKALQIAYKSLQNPYNALQRLTNSLQNSTEALRRFLLLEKDSKGTPY